MFYLGEQKFVPIGYGTYMATPEFDWYQTGREGLKLLIAYLLALPVGWWREKEGHGIGVRTFPLVAVASCGYVLLGMAPGLNTVDAQSRIVQGVVTGIGFIGGGAILKSEGGVHGTATAASIWTTGVLGAAVAQERYLIALVLAVLNLVTLRLLLPLKQKLDSESR
jgi:putative Mg2+ transporter-C (MgtC) family protein